MSLIRELSGIIDAAEDKYMDLKFKAPGIECRRIFSQKRRSEPDGMFFMGDNAVILEEFIASQQWNNKFDMIYCDPPFFTRGDKGVRIPVVSEAAGGRNSISLRAYHDKWKNGMTGYLSALALRLMFMKDALKDTGSIFVHLDWHASHAVKLLMDEIFGEENFINEIIWTYKSGGAAKRHLARKHDNILLYSKSPSYKFYPGKEKSYNRGFKPYHFKGVEEFQDEIGWYTMVNQKDVWQIDMVGRSSSERLNYATQKPEALVGRMVDLVTDKGDLCGDFYCGSGTLAAVAAQKGRRFVSADASALALANAVKRPLKRGYGFELYDCSGNRPENCTVAAHVEDGSILIDSFSSARTKLISRRDREKIDIIMEQDPFALLDYWCAGVTEKDGSFRVLKTVSRDVRGKTPLVMKDAPDNADTVVAVDIFGQTGRTVLRRE